MSFDYNFPLYNNPTFPNGSQTSGIYLVSARGQSGYPTDANLTLTVTWLQPGSVTSAPGTYTVGQNADVWVQLLRGGDTFNLGHASTGFVSVQTFGTQPHDNFVTNVSAHDLANFPAYDGGNAIICQDQHLHIRDASNAGVTLSK